MNSRSFRVIRHSRRSSARVGAIRTAHGPVATPAFMTIATRGSVRALEVDALPKLGMSILLANTYHLWIRPGLEVVRKAKGLHRFMGWNKPILTDSGGYQVFSLAGIRTITNEGVSFRDDVDGTLRLLSPEESMRIQGVLGSDIAMAFDECPSYNAARPVVELAVERTTAWAERCLKRRNRGQLLFGIVQGANLKDLRVRHARTIASMPFDGFAIGGVAMGERVQMEESDISRVLDWVVPELPEAAPRYLMGVGPPDQIVDAVRRGIDLFDCVLPTRNARHELLYVWKPKARIAATRSFWSTLKISRAEFANDLKPIDPTCDCPACKTSTRAYLRHLFATDDPLAQRLATMHNVRFYQRLMEEIRREIRAGRL